MRIHHHDALVSILHHALLQDHPGVLKEQHASFVDNFRPVDIFHPNFQYGRLDPQHCSALSYISCAGVATAAGEVAKDEKHLAMVEKAGGDFIPLVVECFGVQTLFALSVLHSIADRMTTCSGISRKVV